MSANTRGSFSNGYANAEFGPVWAREVQNVSSFWILVSRGDNVRIYTENFSDTSVLNLRTGTTRVDCPNSGIETSRYVWTLSMRCRLLL